MKSISERGQGRTFRKSVGSEHARISSLAQYLNDEHPFLDQLNEI